MNKPDLYVAIRTLAAAMQAAHEALQAFEKLHDRQQNQRRFLDAINDYRMAGQPVCERPEGPAVRSNGSTNAGRAMLQASVGEGDNSS